jgi:hypothetical protein
MARPPSICAHCGYVDLSRLPRAIEILRYMRRINKEVAGVDVMHLFGLSRHGANAALQRLERLGMVKRMGWRPHGPGKGAPSILFKINDDGIRMLYMYEKKNPHTIPNTRIA